MSKTKHLDNAIAILKGTGTAKRAPRLADVRIVTEFTPTTGEWSVQANGKIVDQGVGTEQECLDAANARARRIRALGKTVEVL